MRDSRVLEVHIPLAQTSTRDSLYRYRFPLILLAATAGACCCAQLGAGTGACGLFAAALGAQGVVLTDGAEPLLELMTRNLHQNQPHHIPKSAEVAVKKLRWGCAADVAKLPHGSFDLILGSDVIYDVAAHDALCHTIRMLVERQHPDCPMVVLATLPRRQSSESSRVSSQSLFTDGAVTELRKSAAAHALRVVSVAPPCEPASCGCDSLQPTEMQGQSELSLGDAPRPFLFSLEPLVEQGPEYDYKRQAVITAPDPLEFLQFTQV